MDLLLNIYSSLWRFMSTAQRKSNLVRLVLSFPVCSVGHSLLGTILSGAEAAAVLPKVGLHVLLDQHPRLPKVVWFPKLQRREGGRRRGEEKRRRRGEGAHCKNVGQSHSFALAPGTEKSRSYMQKPLGMVNINGTLRFPAAQEERKASYITSFSSKNHKMICFKQTIGIKSCFFSCKTKSKHNEMIFYMSFCSMLCLYVPCLLSSATTTWRIKVSEANICSTCSPKPERSCSPYWRHRRTSAFCN